MKTKGRRITNHMKTIRKHKYNQRKYIYIYIKKAFAKISDFRLLMNLHILRCLACDLAIFEKYLSVCLYVTNFMDNLAQKLTVGIL